MKPFHTTAIVSIAVSIGVLMSTTTAGAERDLRITVYNQDLGVVSDHREISVGAGQSEVEIADVPARIDPTSVHLKPKGGEMQVLEQNFQYDLAGPDRILERFLDQSVDLILEGGDVKNGTLLSFVGGSVVLRQADGGVELVQRDAIIDIQLPELPDGLRTRPTLVWMVQAKKGGTEPVELSYMTGGMNWHAEYVAVANEQDTEIELSAWISLENQSGATFPNAQLQLIAGDVNRVQDNVRAPRGRMVAMSARAESDGFEEESFFEYHLYTLDRRTTLADRETKQLSLFPTTEAPVEKLFEYNGQRDATKVNVILETENRENRGLGMPLPGGKVRIYKKDRRGQLQFIGEDRIDHTPKNEKIRLRTGKAFDVVGERIEKSQKRISERVFEREFEIKIRNRKEEAISVLVAENLWGDWEITSSTHKHDKKDARTAEFLLPVAADAETVLTFTVRTKN